MLLPIVLSFGAIDALIPLIIIIIIIAAAAGISRGYNIFAIFGIGTLAGMGGATGGKGSLAGKTVLRGTAGLKIGQTAAKKFPVKMDNVIKSLPGAGVAAALVRSRQTTRLSNEAAKATAPSPPPPKPLSANQFDKPSTFRRIKMATTKAARIVRHPRAAVADKLSTAPRRAYVSLPQQRFLEAKAALETARKRVDELKARLGGKQTELANAQKRVGELKAEQAKPAAGRSMTKGQIKSEMNENNARIRELKGHGEPTGGRHTSGEIEEVAIELAAVTGIIPEIETQLARADNANNQESVLFRQKNAGAITGDEFEAAHRKVLDTLEGKTSQTRLIKDAFGMLTNVRGSEKYNQSKLDFIEEWNRSPRASAEALELGKGTYYRLRGNSAKFNEIEQRIKEIEAKGKASLPSDTAEKIERRKHEELGKKLIEEREEEAKKREQEKKGG